MKSKEGVWEMDRKPDLTWVAKPEEYFQQLVSQTIGARKVSTLPEAEFYLVNLLNQFITTDQLYGRDSGGNAREQPLAMLLKDALEESTPQLQTRLFRQVGDISLYVGGFFQDSLNRKLVDVDYYIDVGGTAYRQVAARVDENAARAMYEELSAKFAMFVDVLAEISDKTAQKSEKDILRFYELWVRTRSERAAKALQEAGIIPNETIGKDWQ